MTAVLQSSPVKSSTAILGPAEILTLHNQIGEEITPTPAANEIIIPVSVTLFYKRRTTDYQNEGGAPFFRINTVLEEDGGMGHQGIWMYGYVNILNSPLSIAQLCYPAQDDVSIVGIKGQPLSILGGADLAPWTGGDGDLIVHVLYSTINDPTA